MQKIITVTFNPSIDKSTSVDAILPEKKLRCRAPVFEPGGGGINVARAIRKLGGEATAVYPTGGHTGIFFSKLLHEEGVKTCEIKSVSYTRENLIVRDESTNQQYRFGMPGTGLQKEEYEECLDLVRTMKETEFIVASGSLPPGVPEDIYAQLAVIAREKQARLIVDTSGPALLSAAKEGVYLLKPNLAELAALLGIERIDTAALRNIANEIIEKKYCEILVISMGENGAALATKDEFHLVKPPVMEKKSTVGAGDSMVAGIVMSLLGKRDMLQTLNYGVAAGTAATLNPGTGLCKLEDVTRIYNTLINK